MKECRKTSTPLAYLHPPTTTTHCDDVSTPCALIMVTSQDDRVLPSTYWMDGAAAKATRASGDQCVLSAIRLQVQEWRSGVRGRRRGRSLRLEGGGGGHWTAADGLEVPQTLPDVLHSQRVALCSAPQGQDGLVGGASSQQPTLALVDWLRRRRDSSGTSTTPSP